MVRSLSIALTTEMNSLDRTPYSRVTVERWLPEWTARLSGLSGGKLEQYAHGHGVAVAPNGSAAGEDIICRARSGSYASPQNGTLYVAIIRDANLDTPANWDSLFASTGITGLMYPAWTANSGASHGGSIAVVHSGSNFRVFYLLATGDLRYVDVNYTGTVSGSTLIANLGTGVQLASMQIAACSTTEVFVLVNQLVEASLAAWHKDVYGSYLRRYIFSGSWLAANTFHFHTHAEGGLQRDTPLEGNDFGSTSADLCTAQWGKRFCGGLSALNVDANTVLVSMGWTYWRRWGYDTHYSGMASFIYHRQSGWWQRGPEIDSTDFTEGTRYNVPAFARGCQVEGANVLVWNRSGEPSDYTQSPTGLSMPRIEEVVYAKLSSDGRCWTQFQYLGDHDNLTAASLVVVNHGGTKLLYAIGWRSVYESPAAAFLCSTPAPQDMGDYCDGWKLGRNNRRGMSLDLDLANPSILIDANSVVKSGALAKVYYGTPAEQVLAGLGFVDQNSPSLSAGADGQISHRAALNCRADDFLNNTRAEAVEDVLPQTTMEVPPDVPIQHVALSRGVWKVVGLDWPSFHPGGFSALAGRASWRLLSFPFAQTGGDLRQELTGSWFKDITWLAMPPMCDGAIEASVRWGDVYNAGNFSFAASNNQQMYVTPVKSNTVITQLQWRTGSYGGSIWNTVNQYACMAGLICHAPEVGRKYAYVWEHQSNFASSSHTDDTWKNENFDRADYSSHGTGSNRLYLVASDYDGANWVNKSVVGGITATGLTPGYPADLKMQVLGGTIYCYYRPHSTGTPNQWQFAFSYKAGRFGAGRFGLVGRGHAGIMWQLFQPGLQYLPKYDNVVDFWNIKLSDAVMDRTMEEHLQRYCWRGYTPSEFKSTVSEASRVVNSGVVYGYGLPVENLTIDFNMSIPANGNEGGVVLRGVSSGSPGNTCVRIGLVAHSTANSATNAINYYAVKRRYNGGSEVAAARAYSPLPVPLVPGKAVPVRVTVRGPLYSIWIAGNYAGHFVDETALGLYFGLYATGGNVTFSNIYVGELYEVPGMAILETNQAMSDAIQRLIGRRRIKGFYKYDGTLKFSYFLAHDTGPAMNNNMWQSSIRRNPRYLSKVRVQGSKAFAIFQSETLARRGQRFQVVDNPEIILREFAYKEAQAIVTETAEQQLQANFTGLPDLRLDPEDQCTVTVTYQNVEGDILIEDVQIGMKMGDSPDCNMSVATRQTVAL